MFIAAIVRSYVRGSRRRVMLRAARRRAMPSGRGSQSISTVAKWKMSVI